MSWFTTNGTAIQAICAVLALGAVVVYTVYTWAIKNGTLTQAKASVRQAEASIRPFFIVEIIRDQIGEGAVLYVANIGLGHALDVRTKTGRGDSIQRFADGGAVVKDGRLWLHRDASDEVFTWFRIVDGVRIEYSDLAGKTYWTTVKPLYDGRSSPVPGQYVVDTGELVKS